MPRAATLLFGLTLFLGSALLFLLEPMVGRMLLPSLGGAPAVWNTCLVFFQLAVLGGYLYARLFARYLAPRTQLVAHTVLLIAPLAALPVHLAVAGPPPAGGSPILWLFGALLASVGLPFLVVATTAPLLQQWLSLTDHPDREDPYFLYQASNLGSFAALLAYPTLVEPALGLRLQAATWAWLYGGFAMMVVACSVATWRTSGTAAEAVTDRSSGRPEPPPSWLRRLRWMALAAVPSSLLLGVTTYLSTDIAAVPMLWVIPLGLYLLTFVMAFARRPLVSRQTLTIAMPLLTLPLVLALLLEATRPGWALAALHLVAFFVIALMCHSLLADDRPATRHLTSFYLWLAIGGAAGGLFNAVAAPILFRTTAEYPLALIAACFLKPPRGAEGASPVTPRDAWMPLGLGILTAAGLEALALRGGEAAGILGMLVLAVPALICYTFSPRPVRFGLGVALLVLVSALRPNFFGTLVHTERSFFGIHRVVDDPRTGIRWLFHGTTIHGGQRLDAGRAREPLTYYTPGGPLGQVFTMLGERRRPLRIGVVGLGAGGLASYSRPGQDWVFYEIDPVVVALARDSGYFTFLRDSPARTWIVVGDGRISIARGPAATFDVLVLDAFTSDAVPIHLLTREAVRLYLTRLAVGGILVFNTSNRYLAVNRVVADLARDAGLAHRWRYDALAPQADVRQGKTPSQIVVAARSQADLGSLAADRRWSEVPGPRGRVWTDDYANPFGLLAW